VKALVAGFPGWWCNGLITSAISPQMRGSQVRFLPGSPKIPNQYAAWGNISFGAAFRSKQQCYRGATPETGLKAAPKLNYDRPSVCPR